MTRRDKVTRRSKPGPKREFSKDQLIQVEKLSKLGLTNKELAEFFEVNITTIDYWNQNYPEFKEARRKGGILANMEVADKMFQRAVGYDFWEEELKFMNGRWKKVKVKKHIIPDVRAQEKWLSIKERDKWADTQQVLHKGSINHLHNRLEDIPIEQLSLPAQQLLVEVARKQLADGQSNN